MISGSLCSSGFILHQASFLSSLLELDVLLSSLLSCPCPMTLCIGKSTLDYSLVSFDYLIPTGEPLRQSLSSAFWYVSVSVPVQCRNLIYI